MSDCGLIDAIRAAANRVGTEHFLELLRWHRAVVSLPDLDWGAAGTYRQGVEELGERRTVELLTDLRRAARDPRRHRHGADGKPTFREGRTLGSRTRARPSPSGSSGTG